MVTLRSTWSLDDYTALLRTLQDKGVRWIGLGDFARGAHGTWLRHDVELDLESAARMARVEQQLGLSASYYICVDSPAISATDNEFNRLIEELRRLGHGVSFHLLFSGEGQPVSHQLDALRARFPSVRPTSLTFHAPGTDLTVLSTVPLGAEVYEPVAASRAAYYSDSLGWWRWGNPAEAPQSAQQTTQLLIHPFWWATAAVHVPPTVVQDFLPQLAREFESQLK